MLDPNTAASKWQRNLSGATQSITDGVNAVQTAPTAKAAAASTKWQQNVASANAKSKFENSLKNVSLQAWQTAMIQKGVPRVAAGATAGQPKYAAFASDFFPFLANVTAQTQAMPNLTLQDSINRMTAQITGVSKYQKKS